MDRRRFLIGSGLTGISLIGASQFAVADMVPQIARVAAKPGTPLSPLLSPNLEHILYVRYPETPKKKLSLQILRSMTDQKHQVGSIEEAEDRYFSSVGGSKEHPFIPGLPLALKEADLRKQARENLNEEDFVVLQTLAILISRDANIIAQRTRRGAGNRVFAHPRAFDLLSPGPTTETIQRWTRYDSDDFYNGQIQFWANSRLPKNRIYTAWHGNYTDAPGGLDYDEQGRLTYLERGDLGNDGRDYCRSFDVIWAEDEQKVAA